jgi:plasmid stabilization system protein ParE
MPEQPIITFAASAVTDIEGIIEWHKEEQAPEVGKRLVSEMIEKIETPHDYPDMGRVVPEFNRDNLRELIHPPFRIVYRRDNRRIRIVRIWRSERLLELDR